MGEGLNVFRGRPKTLDIMGKQADNFGVGYYIRHRRQSDSIYRQTHTPIHERPDPEELREPPGDPQEKTRGN